MLSAFSEDRREVGAKDIEAAAKESTLALRQNTDTAICAPRRQYWLWIMMGYATIATVALIILGMVELHV